MLLVASPSLQEILNIPSEEWIKRELEFHRSIIIQELGEDSSSVYTSAVQKISELLEVYQRRALIRGLDNYLENNAKR